MPVCCAVACLAPRQRLIGQSNPSYPDLGRAGASFAIAGNAVESCTIITMSPNALMAEIHNVNHVKQRMPAILAADAIEAWLRGSTDDAHAALKPHPADAMVAWPVSRRVDRQLNSVPLRREVEARGLARSVYNSLSPTKGWLAIRPARRRCWRLRRTSPPVEAAMHKVAHD